MRLEIDHNNLWFREGFPSMHDHRGYLDQPRTGCPEEDRVDMPKRWRIGADVYQRHLELAPRDGKLVSVELVKMPALHHTVVCGTLVDMLRIHETITFYPGLAPQLNHISPTIQVNHKVFQYNPLNGRRSIG
jgi:hypothetical protein